ncbi:MAG: TIGR01777 family oxidoreductase [Myxococcota bacterium]
MTDQPNPGTVLVTGATGLVGKRLVPTLLARGASVRVLTRDLASGAAALDPRALLIRWDGVSPPPEALDGVDTVVHLAGEPVFAGRLSDSRRRRIRESRVGSTDHLVSAISAVPEQRRPKNFVCASAVGYYGDRGDEVLEEDAASGSGFLAEVCRAWEEAAAGAEALGLRRVSLRIGIVLAREGGALPMMVLPFRVGAGGRLGDGKQWFPWIHVDDLVELILATAGDPGYAGGVNATAPNPVRNAELTRALGQVLRRPTLLPAPAFAIRAALGELADELLGSRRVIPGRALARGFEFRYPELEDALEAELS